MKELDFALELAEMDARGARRLSRPLKGGGWFPREVDEDFYRNEDRQVCLRLIVDYDLDGRPLPPEDDPIESDEGVLDAFVGLARGHATQVLDFAQRFGALEMCEHGQPPRWCVKSAEPQDPNLWNKVYCRDPNMVLQPIDLYRQYASEVRAILHVASALHRGKTVPIREWRTLVQNPAAGPPGKRAARGCVESLVNKWVFWGDVAPALVWDASKPTDIVLWGDGLWGALARQLAFAVARIDRWALCHGCGEVYIPKRNPAPGRRTWCTEPSCRIASRRQAQREYRRRG